MAQKRQGQAIEAEVISLTLSFMTSLRYLSSQE